MPTASPKHHVTSLKRSSQRQTVREPADEDNEMHVEDKAGAMIPMSLVSLLTSPRVQLVDALKSSLDALREEQLLKALPAVVNRSANSGTGRRTTFAGSSAGSRAAMS